MTDFTISPALRLEIDGRVEVDVRVGFTRGKPSGVTFFDSDRDSMVTVDFDLWDRVVASVARTVDMQSFDAEPEPKGRFDNLISVAEESE